MEYIQGFPAYGLTYILMATSVIAVVANYTRPSIVLLAAAFVSALLEHSVSPAGLLALALFSVLAYGHFSSRRNDAHGRFSWAISLTGLLAIAASLTFFMHRVPGFNNTKIIDKMVMSAGGVPFSMYLNLDKTAAAIILATCGAFFSASANKDNAPVKPAGAGATFRIILLMWGGCLVALLPLGLALGYIKFDPKIMPYYWIWAANNLFFVAFAEEVLFRGMIQGSLSAISRSRGWHPAIAIAISAILFGLLHIQGGLIYVFLATVAGIFYGTAYYRSGRLVSAILVHFLLNVSHALLFTYPALMP